MPRVACSCALACALCAPSAAQSWTEILVSPRTQHAMAFDAARQRTVLFGGFLFDDPGTTWLYDGSRWRGLHPPTQPPMRADHVMAYDSARQCVVMFGGHSLTAVMQNFDDTWEFEGADWRQVDTLNAPAGLLRASMVYDSARRRMVLFGGVNANITPLAATWEYDGASWTQVQTATAPPARRQHAMAFDSVRQRTVLFGGLGAPAVVLSDTWEFDGSNWQQAVTPTAPPARLEAALAFDSRRGKVVLFGGTTLYSPRTTLQDTWEYDGNSWQQAQPSAPPPARMAHTMAFDGARGEVVLFGGNDGYDMCDTWEYDGIAWQPTASPSPRPRNMTTATYDGTRQRVLLFGGWGSGVFGDTWELRSATWRLLAPTNAPPARFGAALAYDPARDRAVLFGGLGADYQYRDDTWQFDGADWQLATPVVSPPARKMHSLCYDAGRNRVVLFGGVTGPTSTSYFDDTWEFDGSTWTAVTTAHAPSPRAQHAAAYDGSRGRLVLFGGHSRLVSYSDTWEFDGVDWTAVATAHRPAARFDAQFAYDLARGRCLLFSGDIATRDLWEYDGVDWALVTAQDTPYGRGMGVMVHDASDGSSVLFGGGTMLFGDTWRFDPPHAPTWTRHGQGCPGSGGVPSLDLPPGSLPVLGTSMQLQFANLPSAPGALWLALGTDPVQWRGAALPLVVPALGPACRLWIAPEVGIVLAHVGSTAGLALPLPAVPALAGTRLCLQALVFDAGSPAGLGTVSNAGIARLH